MLIKILHKYKSKYVEQLLLLTLILTFSLKLTVLRSKSFLRGHRMQIHFTSCLNITVLEVCVHIHPIMI